MRWALAIAGALGAVASKWEHLGPRNIFDDSSNRGEAGTLADAASPASNPNLIYTGGSNNGASSGILKSTDRGKTWTRASKGLLDTRIKGVMLHPADPSGNRVLAGTPSGISESIDGAASWKWLNDTAEFGLVWTLRSGYIDGEQHIFAGVNGKGGVKGIANIPVKGGEWSVIPLPAGALNWNTRFSAVATKDGRNTVVAAAVRMNGTKVAAYAGTLVVGTIKSRTSANWFSNTDIGCATVALNPNNPDHLIYSNSSYGLGNTYESTDGGKTYRNLNHPTGAYHVAIDSDGHFYTGAEAGAYFSADGGKSWHAYVVNMQTRHNKTITRIPHDYQGISLNFAGPNGVAFPSDQGLFIKPKLPAKDNGSITATPLINACGDMSNNIAIKLAVSEGSGGERFLVTTMWDWAPVASWNSGKNWPATGSYWDMMPQGQQHGQDRQPRGVGGDGKTVSVKLLTKHNTTCGKSVVYNFWLPRTSLPELGIELDEHYEACGGITNKSCGSVSINGACNYSVRAINPGDGDDACGQCGGCALAFFTIERNPSDPVSFAFGTTVNLSWSPSPGPPLAPTPTPTPPPPPSGGPDIGEGGSAYALGRSNHVVVLHFNNIYYSSQGGMNFTHYTGLPREAISHDSELAYLRRPGSRSEPKGPIFTVMAMAPTPAPNPLPTSESSSSSLSGAPDRDGDEDGDGDGDGDGKRGVEGYLAYASHGQMRDRRGGGGALGGIPPRDSRYLLRSLDFGKTWDWILFPPHLAQASLVVTDPTHPTKLYAIGSSTNKKDEAQTDCLSSSDNYGESWAPCANATGLTGRFAQLLIKDSHTMIMLRTSRPPLRTKDGGHSWHTLVSCAQIKDSYSRTGAYSWSGNALVLYGRDQNAPSRGERPMYLWKTDDDGDTWTDQIGDLVTMSPASGVWFEKDFYLSSSGEGIMIRRNFED